MNALAATATEFSSVVPIRPFGSAPPLFFIHGVGGVVPDFGKLLDKLDSRHPVYGIQSQAFDPVGPALTNLSEMATYYLKEIRRFVSHGPYYLIGFSFGGMVAFEMAQQLREQGEIAPFIGMIDSCEMSYLKRQAKFDPPGKRAGYIYHRLKTRLSEAFERPDTFHYMKSKIESRLLRMFYSVTSRFGISIPHSLHYPYHVNWFAAVNYLPKPYNGRITLFKAKAHFWEPRIPADLGWGPLATEGVEIFEIPGDHVSMFIEPNVTVLGDRLARCFENMLMDRGCPSLGAGGQPPRGF
jgi:thioesterase domain-containing protein